MKQRWKLLLGVIALFVAPLLLILVMHFKLKHDVASYKKQLLAKGEKLTIAEWTPSSTNETAGRAFLEAVRPFSGNRRDHFPSLMRMVAPGRAQIIWKSDEPYDWEVKKRTNIWELIKNDFETNAEALEELRAAPERGQLVFPVTYPQGFRALLPHLVPLKQGAVWLSAATIYELHEGNKAGARANLKAMLQFQKNYKGEPILISHLVRIACLNIAFNTTWEALHYPNWTDSELKQFQEDWAALKFGDFEQIFSMERAMEIQMCAEARETGQDPLTMAMGNATTTLLDDLGEFKDVVLTDPKAAFKALFNRPNQSLWKWVKSYRDELELLKMWQAGLEANRSVADTQTYQPALKNLQEKLNALGPEREDSLFVDSRSMVSRTFVKFASAKIAQQLVVTACGLERYNLENGHYPKELKQLRPKFLTTIPRDPIDGQPLRYRLNSDGSFELYSVGENGVDDNGNANVNRNVKFSLVDPEVPSTNSTNWIKPVHPMRALDWVWPLPATGKQIEEWEKHQN